MTWIRAVALGAEDPEVGQARAEALGSYPPKYRPENRGDRRLPPEVMNDSIVAAHSLLPTVLKHVFAGYGAMLDPRLPLTPREHELIALSPRSISASIQQSRTQSFCVS
jgi:hypothetical protein